MWQSLLHGEGGGYCRRREWIFKIISIPTSYVTLYIRHSLTPLDCSNPLIA